MHPHPEHREHPEHASAPVLIAIALSGFIGLAYEVAWTRVLAMVIGPTSYAFSGMLVTFVAGIALGAAAGAALARRMTRPILGLAAAFLVGSAGAGVALVFIGRGPLIVGEWVARPDASFGWIVGAELAFGAALLLPITLALGAAFPMALAAIEWTSLKAGATSDGAASAARVYVANTIGAIAGSLAGGWLLVPALGLRGTIVTLAIAGAIVAALLALTSGARTVTSMSLGAAAAAAAAVVLLAPAWNPEMLSAGAYKYAPYLRGGDLETGLSAGTLLYYREGAAGTVSVRKTAASIAMAIDGKVDASNDADMLTQRLLAHLPLVLHGSPRDVAIVGLGSGVTAGSALAHDVSRVDVLEISHEVVEASAHFVAENRNALRDPRLRLVVGDGRSHLALGTQTYDVIISEPSNPWMAGVAGLFTREFFESARARLAPQGLLCQWTHTYDISQADSAFDRRDLRVGFSRRDDVARGRRRPAPDWRALGRSAGWRPRRAGDGARGGSPGPGRGRRPVAVRAAVALRGRRRRSARVRSRQRDSDRRSTCAGVLGAPRHLRPVERRERARPSRPGRAGPQTACGRAGIRGRHRLRLARSRPDAACV